MPTKQETLQRVLDAAYAGKLGAMDETSCVYDDGDGHRCAVGFFMSDEMINYLRSKGDLILPVDDLFNCDLPADMRAALLASAAPLSEGDLFTLQRLHDNHVACGELWAFKREIKRHFNVELQTPVR